jgi:hypothetical protein
LGDKRRNISWPEMQESENPQQALRLREAIVYQAIGMVATPTEIGQLCSECRDRWANPEARH